MDLLRQSYKDFLVTVSDIYYGDFDDEQRVIMTRIMYKLKSWILKYGNIKIFVESYGNKRLYEINILHKIYKPEQILKREYIVRLKYGCYGAFSYDFVKYIMNHDIHTTMTIDLVHKCMEKHNFDESSIFFEIITSCAYAGDAYYLTLAEEFDTRVDLLNNLYENMYDQELFVVTIFKYMEISIISDFLNDVLPLCTAKIMDAFVEYTLSNKYDEDDTEYIYTIFICMQQCDTDVDIPYGELIHSKYYVDALMSGHLERPNNICNIIAEHSEDDVFFLKYMIKNKQIYTSRTIKLANKNGNIKCAKYMKKHMKKTDKWNDNI